MELTEPQEGVLNIAFRLSDEEGLPLLDLKDLQALLVFIGENAAAIGLRYGNVAPATIGSIQRRLLVLENQGGTRLFGEPALDLNDLMLLDESGAGRINILASDKLMASPQLYATFLLWMLSQLFELLPEVGDPEKPKLVFFFDEAHLLFNGAPKALVDKVEQVARLIRSKGVGIYFISQNPEDIPPSILGQLGNRVQHALRAFTAKDQKALKSASQNYRINPRFPIEDAIREVGTGEAVTSFLELKGIPGMAERTLIRPPSSQAGPIDPAVRASLIEASPVKGKYDTLVDRDSAYEMLRERAQQAATPTAPTGADRSAEIDEVFNNATRWDGSTSAKPAPRAPAPKAPSRKSDSVTEAFAKSFARQLGTKSGQALVRGVLGSLFRSR
jgi:DNA helicase HerA-like ATPase